MIVIDKSQLSQDALIGLAQGFVFSSMGNEFDEQPMDEKVRLTLAALDRGELKIIFSELHQEASIITTEYFNKNTGGNDGC